MLELTDSPSDPSKEDKENALTSAYASHSQKRAKVGNRLPALTTATANYDYNHPFTYAPSSGHSWRENGYSAHAPSSYASGDVWGASAVQEYGRSPHPDFDRNGVNTPLTSYGHSLHLAPILNPSPTDSPAFNQSATMSSNYYPRTHAGHSYMQQQQLEYLHQHEHTSQMYDYGSPYITDSQWDGPFAGQGQA